ncbi:MAG: hypothetical protein IT173_12180 [Acidobacteria bacterium]|nr:hypothetical protein [Acidobacteriota bacterium]
MNFFERLKIAYAMFRRMGGIELPDGGRSSDESLNGAMSAYTSVFGSVSPVIDFEMLKTLKCLWLYNPDVSQYVANIVNLGNPGHSIAVDAASDAIAEKAVERLNESASRIYRHGVGVDGLLNQYLASVAWSGAISSEDVVNFAAGRVEKVVLVPVEQIRFRYNAERDEYEAFQQSANFVRREVRDHSFGLIRLNPETYKYFALATVENSPYAKPPATAAVEAIVEGQRPLMENIRYMAQKIGLMGLVSASVVAPPRKPGETDAEYQARATKYLSAVKGALDGNFNKGLLVTFRDQKIEHTPVATGAQGVYDVNRMSEEQVFSGLHAMPGFHGRTDATTETFADVVYYLLTAQVQNMQRVVRRRQERTYMLDLRLGGIDVDAVSLVFNKAHSRNALDEARTEELRFKTVLEKIQAGAISPDEGANELGLDVWFDEERLLNYAEEAIRVIREPAAAAEQKRRKSLVLKFDKRSQKYTWQPDVLRVAMTDELSGNVVPIKKKAQRRA